jgi:curved DNA-binding protein CbpA
VESPFDVLSVDPDADEAEIDRAYRRAVLETHPDQGGTAEELQRVRKAYERLKAGERTDGLDGEWREPDVDVGADVEREADSRDRPGSGVGATNGSVGTRDDGSGGTTDDDGDTGHRVEYLNYEVLGDHGWTLDDDDLFEKAAEADLDPADYGRLFVEPRESLLEAAEDCGFTWPYSCRGGACANCAVAVVEGEMEMPAGQILTSEFLDRGIRLSCISAPTTDGTKVVYNVKHLPGLDELRLPPRGFEQANLND